MSQRESNLTSEVNTRIKSRIKSKWEYKSFHCFLSFSEYRVNNGTGSSSIEVSEFLNLLGQEGWELTSTMQKTTDYEQILGGSGHPVGIKAHKNTGYEIIMKREIIEISPIQEDITENEKVAFSILEGASAMENEIEDAILDNLSDDISIEDLTEAQNSLASDKADIKQDNLEQDDLVTAQKEYVEVAEVEKEEIEEVTTPLLEGPFYSNDSSATT